MVTRGHQNRTWGSGTNSGRIRRPRETVSRASEARKEHPRLIPRSCSPNVLADTFIKAPMSTSASHLFEIQDHREQMVLTMTRHEGRCLGLVDLRGGSMRRPPRGISRRGKHEGGPEGFSRPNALHPADRPEHRSTTVRWHHCVGSFSVYLARGCRHGDDEQSYLCIGI